MLGEMPAWLKRICGSRIARAFIPAIAGFVGYGSWGVFCNVSYGWEMGLQSGLVQGSLSFTITLIFNGVMEFVYKLLKHKFWSILSTVVALISVSLTVNTLAGTPEVLATIAPGAIIGSFYVYTYISNLVVVANRNTGSAPDLGALVPEPEITTTSAKEEDN